MINKEQKASLCVNGEHKDFMDHSINFTIFIVSEDTLAKKVTELKQNTKPIHNFKEVTHAHVLTLISTLLR